MIIYNENINKIVPLIMKLKTILHNYTIKNI